MLTDTKIENYKNYRVIHHEINERAKLKNIGEISKVYGRLTILDIVGADKGNQTLVSAICECQSLIVLPLTRLKRSKQSCGCLRSELNWKHGLTEDPLMSRYCNILERCSRVKHKDYHSYGGRGIKMCQEWRESFKCFYDWCHANGYERHLQIDRRNNDGDYTPDNCRFVTPKGNANNKRNNNLCLLDGEKMTDTQADNKLLKSRGFVSRIRTGVSKTTKYKDRLVLL